jgi:hypothetical protein
LFIIFIKRVGDFFIRNLNQLIFKILNYSFELEEFLLRSNFILKILDFLQLQVVNNGLRNMICCSFC